MSADRPFFVTTPIYYVNDVPHLGHAYTTIACDVLARFMRLDGRQRAFPDRHRRARPEGRAVGAGAPASTPQAVRRRGLGSISATSARRSTSRNDDFIRTTEQRHNRGVPGALAGAGAPRRHLSRQLRRLVRGARRGLLRRGRADAGQTARSSRRPGAEVEWVEEPSYFFRLSAWQDRLLAFYEANPDFDRAAQPAQRGHQLRAGRACSDLSVSRTSFSWGIPVPGDPAHVIYVWLDALTNYITALGYPETTSAEFFRRSGRPTCTWSARTSCASTRSTGRPS